MMMLEHEGKQLLRSMGVAVPPHVLLASHDDVEERLEGSGVSLPVAVKAQVRSGGRGKAGGVIRADTLEELTASARRLFDQAFGDEATEAVLLEPWSNIARELYLSVTVDGMAGGYVILYAPQGGVDIEEGAPPVRHEIGHPTNFRSYRLRETISSVESDAKLAERVVALAERLLRLAVCRDCTTIEINPLAVTEDGQVIALDAKVVRDEWAKFRQEDLALAIEADRARKPELVRNSLEMNHMYVPLDGDVALISGGAGMTMAAMDMIQDCGGRPACFLDASPGPASTRGYHPAMAMLEGDDSVSVILVSVFGGGTHMDRVASAMRDLAQGGVTTKPVVYRLDGTHVDQVDGILAEIGARNHETLEGAVAEAVALANANREARQ